MGQSTTVIPTGGGGAKVQDSIPTNPQKGDFWVDTSDVTPTVKWYDGTTFNIITPIDTASESKAGEYNIQLSGFSTGGDTIVRDFDTPLFFSQFSGTANSTWDYPITVYIKRQNKPDIELGNGSVIGGNLVDVEPDTYTGFTFEHYGGTDSYSTGDFEIRIPSSMPSHFHGLL